MTPGHWLHVEPARPPEHECSPPWYREPYNTYPCRDDDSEALDGDIWQCECGRRWTVEDGDWCPASTK